MKKFVFIVIASLIMSVFGRWINIGRRHTQATRLADVACDLVTTRAQAGSTRDVYDQLYTFWNKYNPELGTKVIVQHGNQILDEQESSTSQQLFEQKCQLSNLPDYKITFQFAEENLLNESFIELFAESFILIFILALFATSVVRRLRDVWFDQVLAEIRMALGLSKNENIKSSPLSRILVKLFWKSTQNLQDSIMDLQSSLMNKKQEIHKLAAENQKSEQFAHVVTMVSHDLKGPVSALKIIGDSIQSLPDEAQSLKQTITSIEKIISDLDKKKTSPIAASREDLQLEIAEVAIQDVVTEKSWTLASHLNLKIEFDYNKSSLSPIMCEPNHFRRVIANLLQNAIEASPEKSRIQIGVRRSACDVIIEISDQGPGIAPDVMPRLFERGATFGKVTGSGEGLAFAKSRIEAFGGSIQIIDTSNEGTVFQILLPLADTKAKYIAAVPEENQLKLAILDDEIDIQKFAWSDSHGDIEYFEAPNAFIQWLQTPKAQSYSHLVDLHLRNTVNGIDVLRRIGIQGRSFLATSDYLNSEAVVLSESTGIHIIPKTLLFQS